MRLQSRQRQYGVLPRPAAERHTKVCSKHAYLQVCASWAALRDHVKAGAACRAALRHRSSGHAAQNGRHRMKQAALQGNQCKQNLVAAGETMPSLQQAPSLALATARGHIRQNLRGCASAPALLEPVYMHVMGEVEVARPGAPGCFLHGSQFARGAQCGRVSKRARVTAGGRAGRSGRGLQARECGGKWGGRGMK